LRGSVRNAADAEHSNGNADCSEGAGLFHRFCAPEIRAENGQTCLGALPP
jgi:hypothetical protein